MFLHNTNVFPVYFPMDSISRFIPRSDYLPVNDSSFTVSAFTAGVSVFTIFEIPTS